MTSRTLIADEDFAAAEYEDADLLAVISPNAPVANLTAALLSESAPLTAHGSDVLWQGRAGPVR